MRRCVNETCYVAFMLWTYYLMALLCSCRDTDHPERRHTCFPVTRADTLCYDGARRSDACCAPMHRAPLAHVSGVALLQALRALRTLM